MGTIPIFKKCFCCSTWPGNTSLAILGIVGSISIIGFSAVEVANYENAFISIYDVLEDVEDIGSTPIYIINIMNIVFGVFNLLAYGALWISSSLKMQTALLPILFLIPFDILYHFVAAVVIVFETYGQEIPDVAFVIILNALYFIAFDIFIWLAIDIDEVNKYKNSILQYN